MSTLLLDGSTVAVLSPLDGLIQRTEDIFDVDPAENRLYPLHVSGDEVPEMKYSLIIWERVESPCTAVGMFSEERLWMGLSINACSSSWCRFIKKVIWLQELFDRTSKPSLTVSTM